MFFLIRDIEGFSLIYYKCFCTCISLIDLDKIKIEQRYHQPLFSLGNVCISVSTGVDISDLSTEQIT